MRERHSETLQRNKKSAAEFRCALKERRNLSEVDDRGRARPNPDLCAISECLHPTSDGHVPSTIRGRRLVLCA